MSIIPRLWLAPDPNGRFTGSVPVVSGGPPATPHTDAKRATKKTRAITTLAIVSSFQRALLNDRIPPINRQTLQMPMVRSSGVGAHELKHLQGVETFV